jgi:16S rRNA (uracil1498-N3)-methyltransferase
VLAHPDAPAYRASAAEVVRLLVGPEGGFTEEETSLASLSGAVVASFGPHVMRIEVAAPIACAVILAAHFIHSTPSPVG